VDVATCVGTAVDVDVATRVEVAVGAPVMVRVGVDVRVGVAVGATVVVRLAVDVRVGVAERIGVEVGVFPDMVKLPLTVAPPPWAGEPQVSRTTPIKTTTVRTKATLPRTLLPTLVASPPGRRHRDPSPFGCDDGPKEFRIGGLV
jgi:hypothetical protein